MKKILLCFSIALISLNLSAQTCEPDTSIQSSGSYPNQLPPGIAGQYYEEVIQFRIAEDTTGELNGNQVNAKISNVKVLQVLGLPQGINYKCNPTNCTLPGGQTSCAVMYGEIDSASSGTYTPEVYMQINLLIGGFIPYVMYDTMRSLSVEVGTYTSLKETQLAEVVCYPNPTRGNITLSLPYTPEQPVIKVYDAKGKEVDVYWQIENNRVLLNSESFPPGIYVGRIYDGDRVLNFRFVRE